MNYQLRFLFPAPVNRSCSVTIQPGLLRNLPELLGRSKFTGGVFVISDSRVRRLYGSDLIRRLAGRITPLLLVDIPPGERSKQMPVYSAVLMRLLENGIRRDSLIVALGGGVVGDMAGFVAATILRGVQFVQVPTTLLAQVDSSVGGKVGIDHAGGKNLVGAFYQPSAVYVDPELLMTLPDAEFRNGLAEIVKIAAALDARLFGYLERNVRKILARDTRVLTECVRESIELKGEVVQRDEREASLRKALNLGHTIGHALEAAAGYRLRHGYAVAVGLSVEAAIAVRLGLMEPDARNRLDRLLRTLGFGLRPPSRLRRGPFLEALGMDKKGDASGVRFVLPVAIGRCAIGVAVPASVLHDTMRQFA